MIIQNNFHSDDKNHEQVPMSSPDFPYVCIETDMEQYGGRSFPWHWHSSFEILLMKEGSLEVKTPDMVDVLHKGEVLFVNSGVLHTYTQIGPRPCIGLAQLFHMDFLSGAYGSVFEKKYFLPISRCSALQAYLIRPDTRKRIQMILDAMAAIEAVDKEPAGYEFQIRARLCDFWMSLFEETEALRISSPVRSSADEERIKRMLDFIEEHFSEGISVEEIAGAAGVSARECTRCFRRCIDQSPVEYLTQYRVRKAAAMLSETSKTVMEISEFCGFSSPSYFGKVFREAMGYSPKEYQTLQHNGGKVTVSG